MTDPTHTTNEQIALKLGWTYEKGRESFIWGGSGFLGRIREWQDPSGYWHAKPHNFEHNWAHNGPLQDELWAAGFDLSHDVKDGTFYWWRMGQDGPEPLDDDREDTTDLKVATALDWLAWKKEEK